MTRMPEAPDSGRRSLSGALLGLTIALSFGCGGEEEPPPPQEEAVPEPAAPPPESPPPPPPPEPARPTTGALAVQGTPEAVVTLDRERLGIAPARWEDIAAGAHVLRVEKEGFHPFEVEIEIPAGGTRIVEAELAEVLGSIVVESDLPGAMVFLDRAFRGNTPVTIPDLAPGEYGLTVSAEGHEVQRRRVEVGRVPVPVRIVFGERAAPFGAEVRVVHKHRFGSCAGVLVAGPEGFDYRTEHRDAFRLRFEQVERFELDYLANNLRLEVRGGRTYNFESPDEDLDALFVFHREVSEFRDAR